MSQASAAQRAGRWDASRVSGQGGAVDVAPLLADAQRCRGDVGLCLVEAFDGGCGDIAKGKRVSPAS